METEMTKDEIIKFYTDHGWAVSLRSDRIILSPNRTARICLNPRHVRSERGQITAPYGRKETAWYRRWSSAYKDLFITEGGKISSRNFVK